MSILSNAAQLSLRKGSLGTSDIKSLKPSATRGPATSTTPLASPERKDESDPVSRAESRGTKPSRVASSLASHRPWSEMSKHMTFMAQQQEKMVRQAALQDAKDRYSKRFIVLGDFWWDVLRKVEWKKSFRGQIEVASGYATVSSAAAESGDVSPLKGAPLAAGMHEDLPVSKEGRVKYGALNTAFWNAVSIPRDVSLPVAFVDEHLKKVFRYFDELADDTVDYKDLLAAIALFQCDILLPLYKLVRSWYWAYDSAATGGIAPLNFQRMMCTLACDDEGKWAVERHVKLGLDFLIRESQAHRSTDKTINDKLADFAQAARLSKRYGPEYVKKVINAADMPPEGFKAVWSPYDRELREKERNSSFIHIDAIMTWLATQPELHVELQRQRVKATHPTQREKYVTYMRHKTHEEKLDEIDREKGPKADKHRRAAVLLASLTGWHDCLMRNKVIKRNLETFQRQRSVRRWQKFAAERKYLRDKRVKAQEFWEAHVVKRLFGHWTAFRGLWMRIHAVNGRRAAAYHRSVLLQKAFDKLKEDAQMAKAVKKYKRTLCLRYFLAWTAVYGRGNTTSKFLQEVVPVIPKSDVTVTVQDLQRATAEQMNAAELQKALNDHEMQFKKFMAEAAAAAEQDKWQSDEAEAARRRREVLKSAAQTDQRKQHHVEQTEKMKVRFEKDWAERIARAMEEEKVKQKAYLERTKAGRALLRELATKLLACREIEDLSQEASDFSTYVNMDDGCIHLYRKPDPEKGLPALDLNIDMLTVKEAMMVAGSHFAGKKACEVRTKLLADKELAWIALTRAYAATNIQRVWRARMARLRELNALRNRLELLTDPYTAEMYYWDLETSAVIPFPLKFMGSIYLLHPIPEWALRISYNKYKEMRYSYVRLSAPSFHHYAVLEEAKRQKLQLKARRVEAYKQAVRKAGGGDGDASVPDNNLISDVNQSAFMSPGAGSVHSSMGAAAESEENAPGTATGSPATAAAGSRRNSMDDSHIYDIPYTINELATPPPGYQMCTLCNLDFARRQCHGAGCDDLHLYCWSCFVSYHPVDNDEWSKHWDPAQSTRMHVKQFGKVSDEEQLLLKGRQPIEITAQRLARKPKAAVRTFIEVIEEEPEAGVGLAETRPTTAFTGRSRTRADEAEAYESDEEDADEKDPFGRQLNDLIKRGNNLLERFSLRRSTSKNKAKSRADAMRARSDLLADDDSDD